MQGQEIGRLAPKKWNKKLFIPYHQQHNPQSSISTTPFLCGWPNPFNGYTLGMVIFSD